jgi:hypothetical protein
LKGLRSTRHVRRHARVHVPLGGRLRRGRGVVESGKQSLGVEGGRGLLTKISRPRPSVHGMLRLKTWARPNNSSPRSPKRHGSGLHHASPRIEHRATVWSSGSGGGAAGRVAGGTRARTRAPAPIVLRVLVSTATTIATDKSTRVSTRATTARAGSVFYPSGRRRWD